MASTTKATGQRNDMSDLLHDGIAEYISGRFYERKLIDDAWRGTYAECLVYSALRGSFPEAGWRPSGEGKPWDMENNDCVNIQVKQSAALRPGADLENLSKSHLLSFDIHPGKTGRQTHIYVFAWHPETDPDVADHRDTGQWRFCVMPEDELPEPALEQKTQRISLARLKTLAARIGLEPVPYNLLAATVSRVAAVIMKEDEEDGRRADEVMERVRRGEEKVYSAEELRVRLGLDC